MTKSKYFGLNLPSRDTDDMADINQISENFRTVDKELHNTNVGVGEAINGVNEVIGVAETALETARSAHSLAIVNSASGDTITLSDSSELPLRDLKVYGKTEQFTTTGKNLLPYPYYDTTKTYNGLTYTDNGNGGISVKGIATSSSNFYFLKNSITATLVDGETYTFAITGAEQKGFLSIVRETGTREWLKTPCTITWSNVYYENAPSFYVQFDNGENIDTVIFPQIELGTAATEYEQYTGGMPSPNPDYPQSMNTPTDVQVKATGANILDVSTEGMLYNSTKFTVSVFDNGFRAEATEEISASWARTGWCIGTKEALMGKTVTVSVKYTTSRTGETATPSIDLYSMSVPSGYFGNTDIVSQQRLIHAEKEFLTFTFDNTLPYDYICIVLLHSYGGAWGVGDWSQYDDIQVQIGDTATPFEPYTERTLAIPSVTDIGFAGVPVALGGNYTDANGQQWVCDEVDLKRGVYVRRIGSLDLGALTYGQSATSVEGQYRFAASPLRNEILTTVKVAPNDMKAAALSTGFVVSTASALYSGSYGIAVGKDGDVYIRGKQLNDLTTDEVKAAVSGFMFYYELAEPVEIPLDEATLSAFSSLHTNKPNTTITNNSGAWMSAEYVADTKLYIDNKFAELAAAIVSNS